MAIDPNLKREQSKYKEPIASREFILDIIKNSKKKLTRFNLAALLDIMDSESKSFSLKKRLLAMERDGQIFFTKSGYVLPEDLDLVSGTIISHRDGFGFLSVKDQKKDLFINKRDMRFYFNGEEVSAVPNYKKRSCKIISLIKPIKTVTGVLHCNGADDYYLVAKDSRIFQKVSIINYNEFDLEVGSMVTVMLESRPSFNELAKGSIISILAKSDNLIEQALSFAINDYNLSNSWSDEVLEQANSFADTVTAADRKNRVDLTHLPFVTIDGESSKDFDDAVYVSKLPDKSYNLKVAIADVSHYVTEGSALDKEAFARSSSAYFPNKVIPMLPENLSNNLCSLNPKVDRLAMVVDILIAANGTVLSSKFYSAVINSHARLTYDQVGDAIDDPKNLDDDIAFLGEDIKAIYALFKVLQKNSINRGSIGFDRKELDFLIDENNVSLSIYDRRISHKIIEEFMVLANSEASKYTKVNEFLALHRSHPSPISDKLNSLKAVLLEKGLNLGGCLNPTSQDYAIFLNSIKEREDKDQIESLLLRSMSQAIYTADPSVGHFGLSLANYSHFTSPIRRYPDLHLHRVIKAINAKQKCKTDFEALSKIASHCSKMERIIEEATRDFADFLKCYYIKDFVGSEFEAVIVSVLKFGFFARIKNNFIEGFVAFDSMQDHCLPDLDKQLFFGKKSKMFYRIGDSISISVAKSDLETSRIDFLINEKYNFSKSKKEKKK